MRFPDRPLAWAQLSHQKIRLGVAMGGIAFANVLIFMQLGFLTLFNEGATTFPEKLQGDLFLLDDQAKSTDSKGFDRIRLYQAGSIAGVKTVIPVYTRYASVAFNKEEFSPITRIIAYDSRERILDLAEIDAKRDHLNRPRAFLFDRIARGQLAPIVPRLEKRSPLPAMLDNQRVELVGLFTLGNSMILGGEGNLITTPSTYANLFGEQALATVSLGILKVEPGANIQAIQLGIRKAVPGIQVMTHSEFIAKELLFQQENPTGVIFGFGVIMGFVVGIVVVYQVLYADVSDHLAEYATLKAMGYSDASLSFVIFQEASILTIFGYAPGFGISVWMYQLISGLTKLPLVMAPNVAIMVFVLTFIMCICSAFIASGKLRSADPADVF
jgi:putative ABC transport system permease protein